MEVDDVSYDILEWFPILYCQEVFKYLSQSDLTQASLVNKEWCKATAERLQLVFRGAYLNDETKDILRNSERKYQNISLKGFYGRDLDFYLEFIENRAGAWKSVKINNISWSKVIGIIEPTVKELEIKNWSWKVEESMDVKPKWTFPFLKSLKCGQFPNGYHDIYKLFYKCTSLSKLVLNFKTTSEILPLLCNNADLKELDVTAHDWTWLEDLSEFKFKLRKFKILSAKLTPHLYAKLTPHLYAFLEAHAQTLESFDTGTEFDHAFLNLVLNMMPRLSSLSVTFGHLSAAISGWQQPFPVNTQITTLGLKRNRASELGTSFQSFIRAFPSLKHMIFEELKDATLNFLAQEVPALESMEVGRFCVSRLPEHEIFPNIKWLKVKWFLEDLADPTGDYKFADLIKAAYLAR